jgi:hypothetical protein
MEEERLNDMRRDVGKQLPRGTRRRSTVLEPVRGSAGTFSGCGSGVSILGGNG